MGPIRFGSGEWGISLNYQTDLNISDENALKKEADEIWHSFQADAEKAKVRYAVITANEVPEGFIVKHSRAYTFVYQKSDDGSWQSLKKNEAQQSSQPGS